MARPLRIEFPGAIYHVMSRRNGRQLIFRDDTDRRNLLEYLADSVVRCGWELFAFVLMPNHFHLFLRTSPLQPGSGKGTFLGTQQHCETFEAFLGTQQLWDSATLGLSWGHSNFGDFLGDTATLRDFQDWANGSGIFGPSLQPDCVMLGGVR